MFSRGMEVAVGVIVEGMLAALSLAVVRIGCRRMTPSRAHGPDQGGRPMRRAASKPSRCELPPGLADRVGPESSRRARARTCAFKAASRLSRADSAVEDRARFATWAW